MAMPDRKHQTFTDLDNSMRSRLLRTASYRLANRFEDAEDAVQESLISAWKNWDGVDSNRNPEGLLYRTVQRKAIDLLRHIQYEERYITGSLYKPDGSAIDIPTHDLNPEDTAIANEQKMVLRDALGRIPKDQRDPLLLVSNGFSQPEASQFLDVSLQTLKSRVRYGIHHLRTEMGIHESKKEMMPYKI